MGKLELAERVQVPRTVPAWSRRARIFVREFELEATKAGADGEDIDFVRRVLLSPDAYVVYHGGRTRDMTEDEMLVEMGRLAQGLRAWLRERIRRRGERDEWGE